MEPSLSVSQSYCAGHPTLSNWKTVFSDTSEDFIQEFSTAYIHLNSDALAIFDLSPKLQNLQQIINYVASNIDNFNMLVNKTTFINESKLLSPILSSLIGLIPNCASSVVITELYINEIIPFGSCISGLLSESGLGLLVLFKQNKNIKENIIILFTLIIFSSICGIIINYI